MQVSEPKMTAALANDLITEPPENAHRLLPGNDGQLRAHRVITMLPTRTPEGSGSVSP